MVEMLYSSPSIILHKTFYFGCLIRFLGVLAVSSVVPYVTVVDFPLL